MRARPEQPRRRELQAAVRTIEVPFIVEPNYAGWRLDQYLTQKLRHLSRARVQRLIARSLVSDRPLKPGTRVSPGLAFSLRRLAEEEPETPTHVPVLYEDEAIVVVDKPAGLPVHPSACYQHGTLVARLRERYGRGVEPVHRLDRETSGLCICARTPAVSDTFMRAFRAGRVKKEYVAICEGHPAEDSFVVDAPIAAGGTIVRIAVRIDPALGRPARTRFAVLRRFERDGEPFALVRAFPETGRQHQIRLHLQHVGHSIVGDKIYGHSEELYDRFVKHTLTEEDWARLRLDRHALHAERLTFVHPTSGAAMTLTAPLPTDLSGFLADGAGGDP